MSSTTDLVIRLVKTSNRGDEIAFVIALKASAWHDVEDSVGAVSVVCVVAAALNFEVIDVLGIDLRPQIVRDIRVGDRDAVDQPVDLVAPSHVQHIVRHIGCRHVIRDHLHAVGAVRSGSFLDVDAVHRSRRRNAVRRRLHRTFRHRDSFFSARDGQLEMQHGVGIRLHDHVVMHFLEAFRRDRDGVISEWHGSEIKSSAVAGVLGLGPVRILGLQRNARTLNGAVLRIVDDAANGTENLLPRILTAVEAHVTVGEISDRLRKVWGEYRESITI